MKKIIPLISISLLVSVFSVGVVASLNEINNTHEASADSEMATIYSVRSKTTLDNLTSFQGINEVGSYGNTIRRWSADIYDLNTNTQYEYFTIQFHVNDESSTTNPTLFHVHQVTLSDTNFSNNFVLYNKGSGNSMDTSPATYVNHTLQINNLSVEVEGNLIQAFPISYILENYGGYNKEFTFEFFDNINYYFPMGKNINDIYADTENLSQLGTSYYVYTLLDDTFFMSGGQLFNQIRLVYFDAQATSYVDENGNRQVFGYSGYVTFAWLEYNNTYTNRVKPVNNRTLSMYNDNGIGYNQERGSTWESYDYRIITILSQEELSEASRIALSNSLSRMNNAYNVYNGLYISNNALGGVFDLLKSAFSAILPFANIMIIPGISLGMLILLPFIVTLIIVLVRLVKK